MKYKKLLSRLVIGMFLCVTFICVACGSEKEQEETNVIYKDNDVMVSIVEPKEETQIVMSEWLETDLKKEVENSDAVIKCKVDDIKEICISTSHLDANVTVYRTLVTVKIENVLYDVKGSIKKGDVIKVSVCNSSYHYADNILPFIKDGEYYLLLNRSDLMKEDTIKIGSFAEYYINSPVQDIIAIMDDECIVSDMNDNDVKVDKFIEFYNIKANNVSGSEMIISNNNEVTKLFDAIKVNDAGIALGMFNMKNVVSEKIFLEFVDRYTK